MDDPVKIAWLENDAKATYRHACRFLEAIAPDLIHLPTTVGVIDQIDNATVGLTQEITKLHTRHTAFKDRCDDLELQRNTLASAIRLILPLAKGYAAEHPVGSNERYVIEADLLLGGFDISNGRHDAMREVL